jgi:hypothetical protein
MPIIPAPRPPSRANPTSSRAAHLFSLSLVAIALALFTTGCRHPGTAGILPASSPPPFPTSSAHSLLFDLLGEESDVAKLRFIKREPSAISNLTKEIASACGAAHKKLEDFGRRDPALNLKNPMLPRDELETRKAISKTKTKALLTKKGAEFEIELLLSQHEAMVYGQHLALIAARLERDPDRKQFLASLSLSLEHFQAKILEMLAAHYTSLKSKT